MVIIIQEAQTVTQYTGKLHYFTYFTSSSFTHSVSAPWYLMNVFYYIFKRLFIFQCFLAFFKTIFHTFFYIYGWRSEPLSNLNTGALHCMHCCHNNNCHEL